MQSRTPGTPLKRAAEFARLNYHWVFAALAALLVLAHFVPAVYFSAFTADHIQIPLLFEDVVERGHPARDWMWGGHSDIFPDVPLVFLLESVLRNGLLSLQIASGVLLAAYIAALVVLYRQSGGRNAETFGAMLLVFFVLLLIDFGLRESLWFTCISTLALTMHTSIGIIALVCLALSQRVAGEGRLKALLWLAGLCFVTSLADDIFLVLYALPALATLVVLRVLYADRQRLFVPHFAAILAASAAGHLLATRLSPFEIDTATYTHFHAANAAKAWHYFLMVCRPSAGGDFILFFGLNVLFVLSVTALLVRAFFKPPAKRIALPLFMLLVFCACLMDFDWGAAILSGNFTSLLAARHVRLAILLPVFVLLGYINHLIPWSRTASKAAVTFFSLVVSGIALFLTPAPDDYYRQMQQISPLISSIMEKEHIEAGLADYWYANPIYFFSHEAAPVRAVTDDGSMFHWLNTSLWYTGDGASTPPPKFRLIFMAKLDPDKVARHYGAPAQIVPGLPGASIWIYPPEKSITYNDVFGALSNGPANEYRIDGDLLATLTGKREGNSRVARAGRDSKGLLTSGPYPYLRPAKGHYRLTIVHTWLSEPAPGKPVDYDVTYSTGSSARTLDRGSIPYVDKTQREFTRDIEIPDDRHDAFRVRTTYGGSGDISIDSLRITYLGK